MSREKGRQVRLRLFDRGNTRCPICLTPFTKDAVAAGLEVTLEHVPPKVLGGMVKCLTCTDCNQSASKSLDQAVAMRVRADAARKAGRGEKVELDVCGTKHTTYLSPDGISRKDLDSRLVSEPLVKSFLQQLGDRKLIFLAQLQRGPDWDVTKGITITARQPSANHIAVSWLRSSYLLVFSLLGQSGYRYAESEAIRPIRDQIMKPDEELVPSLLCDVSQLRVPDELILINNWQQPFCWIVKLGGLGVLLPQGGTAKHYKEVAKIPDQIRPGSLNGWHPVAFGKCVSSELLLSTDRHNSDRDVFGHEFEVSSGHSKRQCIVVNQDGLVCTITPFGPVLEKGS